MRTITEYINRRDVQNILSKYYPDAGPTTEQILHNINRDIKNIPNADVVTWEQLKKAWAIATADVAPVVHGKWVLITPHPSILYNHYRCSECGEMKYNKSLFCPNCGAKMDSSETDEPEINPCRGCSDYDGNGRCLSDGGCAGTGENKDG